MNYTNHDSRTKAPRPRTRRLPLDFFRPIHPVPHEEGKRKLAGIVAKLEGAQK